MLRNWLGVGCAAIAVGGGGGFSSGPGTTAGGGGASASAAASGGSGVTASASSATSTGSTASGTTSDMGCADGTREAYPDAMIEPNIAGCDGRFQLGGFTGAPMPACNRQAGNNGAVQDGAGCNVADLCAAGWHV